MEVAVHNPKLRSLDTTDKRVIRHVMMDTEGGPMRAALVPLGRYGEKGIAVVDEDDLAMLDSLGLSMRWNRNPGTGVVIAPARRSSGSNVQVARVIVDAGPGENIRYRNGDPTDLRRENIEINRFGYAVRRDRDFLTPKESRRQWGPAVSHEWDYDPEPQEGAQ